MLNRPDPPARGRIALWDNARFVLILLVVFGHAIEGIRGTTEVDTAYAIVYSFHIPAFMLVSGWFARADRLDARALIGTARLFVTWVLAEAAWIGIRALVGDPPLTEGWLVLPSWTLWFLVSLFCMRVVLPYVARFRFPLLLTLIVSLAAGLSPLIASDLSLSRTLSLLPFFVLGWWLRGRGVGDAAWFLAPSVRLRVVAAVVGVVGVGLVLLLTLAPGWSRTVLFWRRGYAAMDQSDLLGIGFRSAVLVLATAITLAFLVLVPRTRHRFSVLGQNTLAIYLLHTPVIFALRRLEVDAAIGSLPGSVVVMLLLAAVLTAALGCPPVARLMRPITEPDWAFRPVAAR